MDQTLAAILAGIFGLKANQISTALHKDDVGSWDSLKQMDLVLTLEEKYNISLEIPDIIKMDSVANIIDVLKNKGVQFED
jgi:acyl carrier protein